MNDDDVIICGNFITDVLEITKVQTENIALLNLDKFACCYKDLLVLMASSLFSRRDNIKRFIFKNLTKNSFNKQKILLQQAKNLLYRGANFPPSGTNRV